MSTMDRLRTMIVKRMGVEPGEVHEGATWEALGMNPSTVADMIDLDVNPAFGTKAGLKEMASFGTVGALATWLEDNT